MNEIAEQIKWLEGVAHLLRRRKNMITLFVLWKINKRIKMLQAQLDRHEQEMKK